MGRRVMFQIIALLLACDSERNPSRANLDLEWPADAGSTSFAARRCTLPAEGCPCEPEGTTAPCGRIRERVGSYIYCSLGSMTCGGGQWSACTGTRSQRTSVTPRPRLLAYGASQSCTAREACNPYCNEFEDTAADLTVAPDDDVIVDNGITLKQAQVGAAGSACDALVITPTTAALIVTQLTPLSPKNGRHRGGARHGGQRACGRRRAAEHDHLDERWHKHR